MSELVIQNGNDVEVELTEEVRGTLVQRLGQRGMVSAEWAVGLIAAVSIAGVLVSIVVNPTVKGAILRFILQVIATFSTHIVKGH